MAEKQEIELYISEEGEVKLHIKGIKGHGCLAVLEDLQKKVGMLAKKEFTSEYYEETKTGDISKNRVKNQ